MWIRKYQKTFKNIKRKDIWRIWTDINLWPTWHGDLEHCKLEGRFEVGNHFFLKPKRMKAVKIMLTEINEGYSFTDCTTFLGAKMYDTHAMEETKDGLKITNTLVVTGPLKWLWIKLVAQNVADTIPEETEALIKRARNVDA
ncbi:MAG: polyketide cyclase [Alphaproteobacteria bacterium]|nr:polyketide cyclase [Alphaproteobacteria bacterium]